MSVVERAYVSRVCALGCIVCGSPAEIHHIRHGMGMGQRNSNFNVLALCPRHHRTGGYKVAFHAGRKTWQEIWGTESELLAKTKELLGNTQIHQST